MAVLEGSALAAGMALGTASALSVGPNNLMLIREGLAHGRIVLVASVACLIDVALLAAALMLTNKNPANILALSSILSWSGLAALCWFSFISLRSYFRSQKCVATQQKRIEGVVSCLWRVTATLLLNPLTYIELLLVPSSISKLFDDVSSRMCFTLGASIILASSCYGYAFGANLLFRLFRRKEALRLFDLGSGLLLGVVSCLMGIELILRPY